MPLLKKRIRFVEPTTCVKYKRIDLLELSNETFYLGIHLFDGEISLDLYADSIHHLSTNKVDSPASDFCKRTLEEGSACLIIALTRLLTLMPSSLLKDWLCR